MIKQFENVPSTYGAPMGRREFGLIHNADHCSIKVFKVNIDSGGYDDGGAYWGIGQPLYCVESTNENNYIRKFVRANSRVEACALANVESKMLRKKLRLEGCGYEIKVDEAKKLKVWRVKVDSRVLLSTFTDYYEAVDFILSEIETKLTKRGNP